MSSDMTDLQSLSSLADVNPSTALPLTGIVSFVGMEDVSENFELTNTKDRNVEDSAGYTRFREGDLLFAKITPCMENGKGAIARGLTNGYGFGSTEFHVLRAHQDNARGFLSQWLRSPYLRRAAEAHMTGSAGQRRVPADFFVRYEIPVLPLPEQRRVAEILDTLDNQIRATDRIIAKLKLTKQGLLTDLIVCPRLAGTGTWRSGDLGEFVSWYSGGTPSKEVANFWAGSI